MAPSAAFVFALFFATGFNACIRAGRSPQTTNACALCGESPCQCDRLVFEDNNRKSLKDLILFVLSRLGGAPTDSPDEATSCHDCRRCRYTCPKKHKVFKVLGDIVKKSRLCSQENEEKNLRDIIVKLIDPSMCERHPCETYCDPQVQKVLKAILKKASGCNCADCPCECILDPPRSDREEYQYWFRTTKDSMRKEIPYRPVRKRDQKDGKNSVQVQHDVGSICRPKTCRTCQKPDNLVCPRYVIGDCPETGNEARFSICADCDRCKMATGNRKNNSALTLFCDECKPMNSPFFVFTDTGYPFREAVNSRPAALRIRTEYLQINDIRFNETTTKTCLNNPFRIRCNRLRKRRKKCAAR